MIRLENMHSTLVLGVICEEKIAYREDIEKSINTIFDRLMRIYGKPIYFLFSCQFSKRLSKLFKQK